VTETSLGGAGPSAGSSAASLEAVPAAVAPPPGNPRFPLVDGIRAIAATSVLFFHAALSSTLPLDYVYQFACGVPIFFLVSGFLLYRPFVAARLGGRRIRIRDYARRRLLRIVPAYWVALTLLAIYPTLDGGVFSAKAPIYYGFAQTYFRDTLFGGLPVAWSLSTEISFYLLLPFYSVLLAWLLAGRRSGYVLRIELAVLLLLSIGSYVFRLEEAGPHVNLAHALPGTFDWFAIGMALAVVSAVASREGSTPRGVTVVQRHPTLVWLAAFLALNLAALYSNVTGRFDPYTGSPLHYLWALIAVCLLLPAVFPGSSGGLPHRVLGLRTVAWLGLVSYGMYLYHFSIVAKIQGAMARVGIDPKSGVVPFVVLMVLALAASAAVGAASYYIVERPFLRLKETRSSRRVDAPARPSATATLLETTQPVEDTRRPV
jgi:peptidoglycan/LPS O-acetylase OafA/YrhL